MECVVLQTIACFQRNGACVWAWAGTASPISSLHLKESSFIQMIIWWEMGVLASVAVWGAGQPSL